MLPRANSVGLNGDSVTGAGMGITMGPPDPLMGSGIIGVGPMGYDMLGFWVDTRPGTALTTVT